MDQNKESSDKSQNAASSEEEAAKTISQNGDSEPDRAEYEQNTEKHKQFQDWTNAIYSLLKKILLITFGIVLLIDLLKNGDAIETVEDFYTIALEHGNVELVAIAVVIFILARSLPLFISGMKQKV